MYAQRNVLNAKETQTDTPKSGPTVDKPQDSKGCTSTEVTLAGATTNEHNKGCASTEARVMNSNSVGGFGNGCERMKMILTNVGKSFPLMAFSPTHYQNGNTLDVQKAHTQVVYVG